MQRTRVWMGPAGAHRAPMQTSHPGLEAQGRESIHPYSRLARGRAGGGSMRPHSRFGWVWREPTAPRAASSTVATACAVGGWFLE